MDGLGPRVSGFDPPSGSSRSSRRRSSRRAFLAAAGAALTSAVAGCNDLDAGADAPAFHDGDWRSYGNGPGNANRVAGGAPEADAHDRLVPLGWPHVPPVVLDGTVYFATGRNVVALSPDGERRWERDLRIEASGALAADATRGRLYVPSEAVRADDGSVAEPASVAVLSLGDGEAIDRFAVGGRRAYGATVVEGDVYVRSATGCVRLGPDGTARWRRSLDPLVYEEYNVFDDFATQVAPAVAAGGVYVTDRNALVGLDPETGAERWRVPVDTPYAAPVVTDDVVVQTGRLETVAVEHSGDVRWRRDLHSDAAAAVAADGDVYVAAGDLHEVDPETGETNWHVHLSDEYTAAPVVTDEAVIVADGDVYAFRRDAEGLLAPDRERWRNASVTARADTSPVVAAGRVFAAGFDFLLALEPGGDG